MGTRIGRRIERPRLPVVLGARAAGAVVAHHPVESIAIV